MEKYASKKKIIHDSFYQQISQTTNENKFLMNDMNKISSQNKIQKSINNLRQNPQPIRKIPMVSFSKISPTNKFFFLLFINFLKNIQ